MMRTFVMAIGGLLVCVAIWSAIANAAAWPASIAPAIIGILILTSLVFEKRYRGERPGAGAWQATAERFVDPTTGKLMEVRFNPRTGERAYVPVDR